MSAWRRVAIEMLPSLKRTIEESTSPMELWINLTIEFEQAYKRYDKDLIEKTYEYSDWCIRCKGQGRYLSDVGDAVALAFYEHIPTIPKARAEMHLFFTKEEFLHMEALFSYHLSEGEYKTLKKDFLSKTPVSRAWKAQTHSKRKNKAKYNDEN